MKALPRPDLFSTPLKDKPWVESGLKNAQKTIKMVDLFAGVGGFHYGVSAAAARKKYGVDTILVSEIEETCQEVYHHNFGSEITGDINSISTADYARKTCDILTAGFPCQPFSNSGKKLGLSDPRGQFYFKIEELIRHFKSKAFILENVPGIKSNGGGKYLSQLSYHPAHIGSTMKFLEDNLAKLKDYRIKWIELDSSIFGSPQVRRRVYIVGIHKDFCKSLEFNFNTYFPLPFISVAEKSHSEELNLSANQVKNLRSFMKRPPSYMNGMRRVGNAYLCAGGNVGQGYHAYGMVPTLTVVWARFLPIYFPHEKENLPQMGEKRFEPNRYYGSGYFRRASVRETARLQGFPESYKPHERNSVAYEHSGNAVNAKVVRELAENIFRYII